MNSHQGQPISGRVLHTPTLVLFGADDALLPKDALTVSPEDAPHTTVEFVPGGAHFLVDDNPDEVGAADPRLPRAAAARRDPEPPRPARYVVPHGSGQAAIASASRIV